MKMKPILLTLLAASTLFGATSKELLAKGIFAEEVQKDYPTALTLYQRLATGAADSSHTSHGGNKENGELPEIENQKLVALAHYRLASLFHRGGDKALRDASCETIATKFAQFSEIAEKARILSNSEIPKKNVIQLPADSPEMVSYNGVTEDLDRKKIQRQIVRGPASLKTQPLIKKRSEEEDLKILRELMKNTHIGGQPGDRPLPPHTKLLLKIGAAADFYALELKNAALNQNGKIKGKIVGGWPVPKSLTVNLSKLDESDQHQRTLLLKAVSLNNFDFGSWLNNALGAAIRHEDWEMVDALKQRGVTLWEGKKHRWPIGSNILLKSEPEKWTKEELALVISVKGDINFVDLKNSELGQQTPLQRAIMANDVKYARNLVQNGADPNLQTQKDSPTPLHLAASQGNLAMIKLLLNAGANANASSSKAQWLVSSKFEKGIQKGAAQPIDLAPSAVQRELLIHGASCTPTSFLEACRSQDQELIGLHFKKMKDLDAKTILGETVADYFKRTGNEKMVKEVQLLKKRHQAGSTNR